MTAKRPELLEATDETIVDAVQYADPMVLRGLLYQLTGDEELTTVRLTSGRAGRGNTVQTVADASDVAMIRSKAAEFLRRYRDAGAGDIPPGPPERLRASLGLAVGTEIPAAELGMWTEQLALDPFARGLVWPVPPSPEQRAKFSVVVIGAGLTGLNAAVQLRQAGIPFTVLEKNPGVGGTWYENRYPGARVDTGSRTYTHIFGADFPYPSPYCPQVENEKYLNWVADNFDVRKNIVFGTEVRALVWDDESANWHIATEGPEGEQSWEADAVIVAIGFLSRPNVPQIDGLDAFRGRYFHTARWPSDLDVTGKRVAVVGSGCTGYQLAAELAKDVGHLYLFQRTPSWVFDVPGYLAPYPPQINWLDRNFPYLTNFIRFTGSYMNNPTATAARLEIDPEFHDPHTVSENNKRVREDRINFMRSKFAGRPDLMEKMLPDVPPFSIRPVFVDRDYSVYDALLLDHVSLVSEPIDKVTETGIRLKNGEECSVDVIALATGFKANDYLWPMEVRGRGGVSVEDLWAKDGARAYLGTMLPGFPNLFMLYGPNTNYNVGILAVHLAEVVTRFALECIASLITENKKMVEVTSHAYWQYNDVLDRAQASKVYMDRRVHTYYQNGFGRSATNGAIDARLLWEWLRDPRDPEWATPKTDEDPVMKMRNLISPYFGRDLILS
ncbi:MAG: NAD(P)/FAD-dependent oxidoreductase [Acidimicrobiaceae bacterium]|nr:NAD(P)/FAD-dependent oxidoreductase [Acidimicrobiaceae bacterium]